MALLSRFRRSRKVAFFDLDGVLADDTHRVGHALALRWEMYFDPAALARDGVWEQGRAALVAARRAGWTIAYMTGRREDLRSTTVAWLRRNGFPKGALHMRQMGDRRPLAEVKAGLLAAEAKNVTVMLYDDDPEVVRVVRARLGDDAAVHCTWHIKQKALIKKADA